MKNIKLNDDEYHFLNNLLPSKLKSLINSSKRFGQSYVLDLLDDEADEIRDLCGEQLQIVGFDETDEPTREGMILESLIDKFFIG